MNSDSPHYSPCIAVLRQSPLFAKLSETELGDMMAMFRYERKEKHDVAISPKDAFGQILSGHQRARESLAFSPGNGT